MPSRPITVGIDDENGLPLGYGVIPNVSEAGACLWTDSYLEPGALLILRISFVVTSEVHEVAARVVWSREGSDVFQASLWRYGLQWLDFSMAYLLCLEKLAREGSGRRATGSHSPVRPAPEPELP